MGTPRIQIFLFPGLHGTTGLFDAVVKTCPPGVIPVPVPLPNDRPLDYNELKEATRHQLRSSSPYLLLGESFSGPLVIKLAAENPENLIGVVLTNSFVQPPAPSWLRFLPIQLLARFPIPRWAARCFAVGANAEPAVVGHVIHEIGRTQPGIIAARVRMVLTCDVVDELRRCPVPILYLRGTKDWLVWNGALKRIQSHARDVSVATTAAPHLILQTHPEWCWNEIRDFVQRKGFGNLL